MEKRILLKREFNSRTKTQKKKEKRNLSPYNTILHCFYFDQQHKRGSKDQETFLRRKTIVLHLLLTTTPLHLTTSTASMVLCSNLKNKWVF